MLGFRLMCHAGSGGTDGSQENAGGEEDALMHHPISWGGIGGDGGEVRGIGACGSRANLRRHISAKADLSVYCVM